jgi:NAD(P)-dependent dehydrogenase (short-subunit alcohol dehydrogenase family)
MASQQSIGQVDTRRVVLITGASSGIGKTCAEYLARRGWRVFGTQRRPPGGVRPDAPFEMVAMDVDCDSSVDEAVRLVHGKAGRLDAVVNNAGISLMGAIEDISIGEAKAQLETNFFGVLRVCRAVLPIMRQQGGGHIVNISSLAGIVGLPYSGMYSASKFALEGVSQALRLEVKPFGIRVSVIEPGDFRSDMPNRRVVAAASGTNDAYAEVTRHYRQLQDHEEATAPLPEPVARLLERVLNDPNPKFRYPIAKVGHRVMVSLFHLLPQRAFEWLLVRVIGLNSAPGYRRP